MSRFWIVSDFQFFAVSIVQNSNLFWKQSRLIARAERVVALTKIVRSEKAQRTGEYASNPERKNTPCISDLAGVKFLLKKERVFFFRGSALQVFGQCVGLQYGLGKAKIFFWGKGFFALPRLLYRPQEGSGEECGRDSLQNFFRNARSKISIKTSKNEKLKRASFLFLQFYFSHRPKHWREW